MGDLYRAEKERADALEAEKANLDTIRNQAESTQTVKVSNPMPDDLASFNAMIARANK